MTKNRFKKLGNGSFFGGFLYERAIPKDPFLRKPDAVVAWQLFMGRLVRLYKGCAKRGRPPYSPVLILKMLLLSYLHSLSDRQTESSANDSLAAKCFLGLAVDEAAPDYATVSTDVIVYRKHRLESLPLMSSEELPTRHFSVILSLLLERATRFTREVSDLCG